MSTSHANFGLSINTGVHVFYELGRLRLSDLHAFCVSHFACSLFDASVWCLSSSLRHKVSRFIDDSVWCLSSSLCLLFPTLLARVLMLLFGVRRDHAHGCGET